MAATLAFRCVFGAFAIAAITIVEASRPQQQRTRRELPTDWSELGQNELKRALLWKPNMNVAKNVIVFLGDGMGVSTVTAARFYLAQRTGQKIEDTALAWEEFYDVGLSKTYTVDRMTADSGGTATAYLTGVKTRFGVIGMNQNVLLGDCSGMPDDAVNSVLVDSKKEKWTGIVTNTRVTHATPAAAYAHSPHRYWESGIPDDVKDRGNCRDIATQLIDDHEDIRVVLGGGRQMFRPVSAGGKRKDDRDLIEAWKTKKADADIPDDEYAYLETNKEFTAIDADKVQYLFGLFSEDHMDYEVDRLDKDDPQPSLSEMTEKAIKILQHSASGYFLLVEGGRIDHCHHVNRAFCALNETVAMNDAVRAALKMTSEDDTLIIVTADHSHVMTMGGYPTIHNDIFGLIDAPNSPPVDEKPILTLSYTDGPGYAVHRMVNGVDAPRKNLTNVPRGKAFVNDAAVHRKDESHGGEDVGVYARGPMSHLFHGVHEQHYIAHVIRYASCIGENRDHCTQPRCPAMGDGCATAGAGSLTRTSIIATAMLILMRLATTLRQA